MGENGLIMPMPLPLSSERLERHGLYLIEDGQTMFLWIGRDAVDQLVMDVFNLPAYEQLRGGKVRVVPNGFLLCVISVLNSNLIDRQLCQFSIIRSHSVLMRSSRRLVKCVADPTTHTCTW